MKYINKLTYLFPAIFLLSLFNLQSQCVYELNNSDYYLGASIIGIGVPGYFMDKNMKAPTEADILKLNPNDINSFDRNATKNYNEKSANFSDLLLYTSVAAPAILAIDMGDKKDVLTHALMMIETIGLTGTVTNIVKTSVQRYRPFTYNPEAPQEKKLDKDAKVSFFSGHTSVSFASMTFLAKTYSDYYPNSTYTPYVWAGSMVLASTIGYLRYDAGKHFPSDIIVGAIVGASIGYIVPEIHKRDNKNSSIGLQSVDGYRISFSYKF